MRYTILLVDDESVDLEWLKRRIAERNDDLQVVASVNSAFAALGVLEERTVDVMLTDIRMPIMSGLELAAKARQLQPHIQIVFVSGHEDFEYAKQAIKVHASAYLLKPVDDRELQDTLAELTARMEEERRLAENGKNWTEAMPLIEKELILAWLEGTASPQVEQVAENALRLLGAERGMAVALIEIDDVQRLLETLSQQKQSALTLELFQAVEAHCAERGLGYCVRDKRNRIVLIAACGEDTLVQEADGIVKLVGERFPLTVTIGTGGHVARPASLGQSFEQAKQALKRKLFAGKNRVIAHAETQHQDGRAAPEIDGTAEAMFHDMLQYRLVAVDEHFERLFAQAETFADKTTIVGFIVHFLTVLHTHCQRMNENLYELLQWDYAHLNAMDRFETIHDMKSWLRRKLFELSELLYIKQQKQHRKIISEIMAYVDSQLDSKITLKQVAGHFGFSPNYLGLVFKEETGDNFSNYLIRARMKRACELLLDPKRKVYEIADQMGYRNILYFNRQFKLMTCMTPGEYRKAHHI